MTRPCDPGATPSRAEVVGALSSGLLSKECSLEESEQVSSVLARVVAETLAVAGVDVPEIVRLAC